MEKTMMTMSDAAEYLRYSHKYFSEHYKELGVPYVCLKSGKILFVRNSLKSWVETQEIQGMKG